MTPEKLRQLADDLDKKAEEAFRAGKGAEGVLLSEAADEARDLAEKKEREAKEGKARLPAANRGGKYKRKVVAAERLRVSKGRSGDEPDALVKAVNDAGFTVRSLVEKLREEGYRVSHPFLNQCRLGESRIRKPLAERIEALTGFRASKANWPKGWAREPAAGR